MSRLRDRIFLLAAALGVSVLLLLLGLGSGNWFVPIAMVILLFGSIVAIEVEENRRRPTKLRRWWPLAVAWLALLMISIVTLLWMTERFGLRWRFTELTLALLVGFAIWEFIRESLYPYCEKP